MILFDCSHCGTRMKANPTAIGRKGRCVGCGQSTIVPAQNEQLTLAELVNDDPIPVPVPVPAPEQSDALIVDAILLKPASDSEAIAEEIYDFLRPAEDPSELGRLGPYVVREVLGVGGMGVVFRAEDPQLKRSVALKALLPALAASTSHRKRFMREAQAVAGLQHDHIVTIFQVGEDRSIPYFAMQLLEGQSLDRRCRREPIFPIADVLQIGREIADGLAAAHHRGIIHRDIKPANIWLETRPTSGTTAIRSGVHRPKFRVKLLDFGLARDAQDTHPDITQAGMIVGTPAYMAPEQAKGKAIDSRADLFSLGTVLYQLCTGEGPFRGSNTQEILSALAHATPRPIRRHHEGIPPKLARLIEHLLAKSPTDRPATAQEVADRLADIPIPKQSSQQRSGFVLVDVEEQPADVDDQTMVVAKIPAKPRPHPSARPVPAVAPKRSRTHKPNPPRSNRFIWIYSLTGATLGGIVLTIVFIFAIPKKQPSPSSPSNSMRPFVQDKILLPDLPEDDNARGDPTHRNPKRPPRL